MGGPKRCGCTAARLCGMHAGAARRRQFLKHGTYDARAWDRGWYSEALRESQRTLDKR